MKKMFTQLIGIIFSFGVQFNIRIWSQQRLDQGLQFFWLGSSHLHWNMLKTQGYNEPLHMHTCNARKINNVLNLLSIYSAFMSK